MDPNERGGKVDRKALDELLLLLLSAPRQGNGSVGPSNEFLRFKGNYTLDNGDPYREWTLLVDVPEIAVATESALQVDLPGKPHLQAGDVMREIRGVELSFKRNGIQIASPERWQLREMLAGLEGQPKGRPAQRETDPDVAALHRLIPGGPWRPKVETSWGLKHRTRLAFNAFRAIENLPAFDVRAGDFLIQLRSSSVNNKSVPREIVSGYLRPILRAELIELSDEAARFRGVDGSWGVPDASQLRTGFLRSGKNKNAKTHKTPFFILRPWTERTSASIVAGSDEAAIFELLSQVGGRMPMAPEEDS